MIRIKPNKCGYGGTKGYTCEGIPNLRDSGHMFDESVDIVAELDAEYNKLPKRIKGMVYSEETINMAWPDGGPHPEVAELSCKQDTYPDSTSTEVSKWGETGIPVTVNGQTYWYPVYGSTSGWADLYNSKYSYGEDPTYFYRDSAVGADDAKASDVYIMTPSGNHGDIFDVEQIPVFTSEISGDQPYEMGPGLLEPMLDTDFDPIGIDTIPSWEAGLDALTYIGVVLNGWKGVVDDRFRNIYWRLNNLPMPSGIDENLLDLIDDQYSSTDCTNFRITLSEGQSLQKVGETPVTNTYAVSAGDIYINDEYVHVAGISVVDSPVPFRVWLHIYKLSEPDPTTGNTWGAILSTDSVVSSDPGNYAIGGVEVIQAGYNDGAYILYKVFQEDCLSNIAIDEDAVPGILINGSTTEEWIDTTPVITPVTGIVDISESVVVGATPSLSTKAVPSVKAVYDFIHETTITKAYRALVTAGTMSSSGSSISLSGYTPGTSVVVGNISVVGGSTTTNVAYVVPNAKAVVSFVLRDAVPSALEVASASEQSESWKSNWPKPVQSTVEVSSNILIGRTPGIAIRAVPSVKAVYDFVHSPDTNTNIAFYGSLAISQIINAPVGGSTYATLAAGALPGTCYVVTDMEGLYGDNVVLQSSYTIDGVVHGLVDVVPTAEAVKRYVAAHSGSVAGATAGTLVAGEDTEEWSTTSPAVTAVQGIVYTTTTIVVGNTPSISLYAVPTVKAVKDYVDQHVSPSTYTGPFAVKANATSGWDIQSGRAYFGSTSFVYNGDTGEAGEEGDTFWVTFVKGSTGTVGTANITGVTAASFPIARIESGKPVQLQYGDITIMGRWM